MKENARQSDFLNKAVYMTESVAHVGQGQQRKLDHYLAEKSDTNGRTDELTDQQSDL